MWNDNGKTEVDRGAPERIPPRIVVVTFVVTRRVAGHHHAVQAEIFDASEIGDAFFDRTQRGLTQPDEPRRVDALELGDPQVVRVEARLLVVGVGMVAQDHADRRIDHLGRDTVAVLFLQPLFGIPTTGMQLFPRHEDVRVDLVGGPAGRGHHAIGQSAATVVDRHRGAHRLVGDRDRCPITELGIDAIDVTVSRFGDVRVGRDGEEGHDQQYPSACRSEGRSGPAYRLPGAGAVPSAA